MDKLRKIGPQKLAIIAAVIIGVLGIVGMILAKNILIVGIIMVVLQIAVVFFLISQGSEQAQEKSQSDKYRKLFKNLPIGFAQAKIIMDPAGDVIGYQVEDANNTFGGYFGLDKESFIGKILGESNIEVLQDINAWFKAYNTSGIREGDLMDVEITMEKLGKVFNTVMYKSEAEHINMVVIDVTEQKETEAKLSKAIEDANAAYKTQAEFLANMSHEIRTPINGILGMIQLTLMADDLQADYRDNLITAIIKKLTQQKSINRISLLDLLKYKYHFKNEEAVKLNDFLLQMLNYLPENRPSASKMLSHPWLNMPPNFDYIDEKEYENNILNNENDIKKEEINMCLNESNSEEYAADDEDNDNEKNLNVLEDDEDSGDENPDKINIPNYNNSFSQYGQFIDLTSLDKANPQFNEIIKMDESE